ncbi:MAG TPA: SDR family NAD(P)-dependent oxidoreductase [Acidimicrobiales bacterium]|nr:SDR family NAD(P)-dependent oxidoreductase [Acidimicrobiales bacterium]
MSLDARVALVTGAWGIGSIGREVALRLAREGADVVVSDIPHPKERIPPQAARVNWQGIEAVRAEIETIGRRSRALECDLTDEAQIDTLVETTLSAMGRIDILVNAARAFTMIGGRGVSETTEADWDLVMAVNVRGPMTLSKQVARAMIAAGRGGSIINISSIAAKQPSVTNAAYSASKAALNMLTRVMALELAPHGIRVNAICPGTINTTRVRPEEVADARAKGLSYERYREEWLARRAKSIPMQRVGTPEDVAGVVYFLASEMSNYMTGQCLSVDGGEVME